MSYLLYIAVSLLYICLCTKAGITDNSDTTAIVLAILTAGEVISWGCRK